MSYHLVTQDHGGYAACKCGWFVISKDPERVAKLILRHRMEYLGRSPLNGPGQ